MKKRFILFYFISLQAFSTGPIQTFRESKGREVTYHLKIDYKSVNFTGKTVQAMSINNSLPAPTLYFREGDKAVIHVTNNMDVESSLHWHGILLPNLQDGVPYLTTPPILPGQTYTYRFPLKQSGTYWYHSHTGLQEQRGLYGAFVVEPKQKTQRYDYNLVFVLSDWTDEDPREVMRTLKRGSEWYAIQKKNTQSFSQVIASKALLAQLKMWKSRMPGMDISDVYYPAFLINGKRQGYYPINQADRELPDGALTNRKREEKNTPFKGGEIVRLRVINASASTYFWLTFGGEKPLLISADGLDVQPVPAQNILQAIGETYDFLLRIPKARAIQFRAMAQDGSGSALAHIGRGEVLKAPVLPKPDLFEQMKDMAKHHHGHQARKTQSKNRHIASSQLSSSQVQTRQGHSSHAQHKKANARQGHDSHTQHKKANARQGHDSHTQHKKANARQGHSSHSQHKKANARQGHSSHAQHKKANARQGHSSHAQHKKTSQHKQHSLPKEKINTFSYQKLRSLKPKTHKPSVREITLNLNGNMWRYVWSMNNKTLSESDKIQIKKGERLRLTLNNQTMMHHPMHLHGHFFRVLTKQGKFSPLKHTVDVPPMESLIIEFDPEEEGDWLFHCHVLYHMMGGMSRIFSHNSSRSKLLQKYPARNIINKDNKWYQWGEIDLMGHRMDWEAVFSNTRNKVLLDTTFSWFDQKYQSHQNFETSLSYERFTSDFFRFYTGLELENKTGEKLESWKSLDTSLKLGFRYLLPYFIELDMSLDHEVRWEVELDYELHLLPRLEVFADWSLRMDLGLVTDKKHSQQEWQVGGEYILSKSASLKASYSNHFGWGAGLNIKY